jgi:glycosyltransferase involved in cell wall biosynthesis
VAAGVNAVPHLRKISSAYISVGSGLNIDRIYSQFSDSADYVVILPHIVVGGADKYAANLVRVLSLIGSVIVLVTDQHRRQTADGLNHPALSAFLDSGARIVFLQEIFGAFAQNEIFLARLLHAAKPKSVIIINSDVGLKAVARFGRGLSLSSRIYCAFFSMGFRGLGAPYANRYARKVAPYCLFVSDTEQMAASLKRLVGSRMQGATVIPPVVQIATEAEFSKRILGRMFRWEKPHRPRWLWVSRIEPMKGTSLLPHIAGALPDVDFDIFGPVEQQSLASVTRHRKNITYRGIIANMNTFDATKYDGFLFTSFFEGMPNVVLEVSQHGLPMVLADVGGIGSTFDLSSAVLVEHADPPVAEPFVHAIRAVQMMSVDQVRGMVQRARAVVRAVHDEPAFARNVRTTFNVIDA